MRIRLQMVIFGFEFPNKNLCQTELPYIELFIEINKRLTSRGAREIFWKPNISGNRIQGLQSYWRSVHFNVVNGKDANGAVYNFSCLVYELSLDMRY